MSAKVAIRKQRKPEGKRRLLPGPLQYEYNADKRSYKISCGPVNYFVSVDQAESNPSILIFAVNQVLSRVESL